MLHGVGVRVPSSAQVCENSSAGRAQPCQGWGRGFESRFSLKNRGLLKLLFFLPALVVELVDTQDLKSCIRKDVRVQVPSGVLKKPDNRLIVRLFCFLIIIIYVSAVNNFSDKKNPSTLL